MSNKIKKNRFIPEAGKIVLCTEKEKAP